MTSKRTAGVNEKGTRVRQEGVKILTVQDGLALIGEQGDVAAYQ